MAENTIQTLRGSLREAKGKGGAKQLRNQGFIPGNYYHSSEEPVALQFDEKSIRLLLASHPTLIKLQWGEGEDQQRECLIREVQRHPVSQKPIHIDFLGITRGVKITATVQLHIIGVPEGVKHGGLLQQTLSEAGVSVLPKDLPRAIEVDVTSLELGESIHLRDIEVEGVEWEDNPDSAIATVIKPGGIADESEEEEDEGEEEVASEE